MVPGVWMNPVMKVCWPGMSTVSLPARLDATWPGRSYSSSPPGPTPVVPRTTSEELERTGPSTARP